MQESENHVGRQAHAQGSRSAWLSSGGMRVKVPPSATGMHLRQARLTSAGTELGTPGNKPPGAPPSRLCGWCVPTTLVQGREDGGGLCAPSVGPLSGVRRARGGMAGGVVGGRGTRPPIGTICHCPHFTGKENGSEPLLRQASCSEAKQT